MIWETRTVGRGAASFGRVRAAGLAVCKCIFFTYRQSEPTLEFSYDLRERRRAAERQKSPRPNGVSSGTPGARPYGAADAEDALWGGLARGTLWVRPIGKSACRDEATVTLTAALLGGGSQSWLSTGSLLLRTPPISAAREVPRQGSSVTRVNALQSSLAKSK